MVFVLLQSQSVTAGKIKQGCSSFLPSELPSPAVSCQSSPAPGEQPLSSPNSYRNNSFYTDCSQRFITPPPSNSPVVSTYTPVNSSNINSCNISNSQPAASTVFSGSANISQSDTPMESYPQISSSCMAVKTQPQLSPIVSTMQTCLPQTSPITPTTSPVPSSMPPLSYNQLMQRFTAPASSTAACSQPNSSTTQYQSIVPSISNSNYNELNNSNSCFSNITAPAGSSCAVSGNSLSMIHNSNANCVPPTQPPAASSSNLSQLSLPNDRDVSTPYVNSFLPVTKDKLFEHQLRTDQKGAIHPDYKTPFKSKLDACKRLIRYHVFSDKGCTQQDLLQKDAAFELQAENLLKKKRTLEYKYQSLLLKDSQRRHPTAETVMLYRFFLNDEKAKFERERALVAAGKEFDLEYLAANKPLSSEPVSSSYPWEDNWHDDQMFTFSPRKFEEPAQEESTDLNFSCNNRNEDVNIAGDGIHELAPSTAPQFIRHTKSTSACSANDLYNIDEKKEPEILDISFSTTENEDDRLSLSFAERFKKTQKIQEDLYDKLLANTSASTKDDLLQEKESAVPVFKQDKPKSPIKDDDDDWDEEEALDEPALQIMEESEPELEPLADTNSKDDDDACVSPDLSPDRGFARRDSIVYRRPSSCDSVDSSSPELRVITTTPTASVKSPHAVDDNPDATRAADNTQDNELRTKSSASLDDRFNYLCKVNGVADETSGKRKFNAIADHLSPTNDVKQQRVELVGTTHNDYSKSHLLVQQPHSFPGRVTDHDKRKSEKMCKSSKESKKLKIKLKSDKKGSYVVPSIRIRTEEKGTGALKMTLKKQGSGAYIRVDDEPSAEYRVEQVPKGPANFSDKNGSVVGCSSERVYTEELNKSSRSKRQENSPEERDRKRNKRDKNRSDKYKYESGAARYPGNLLQHPSFGGEDSIKYQGSEWYNSAGLYHSPRLIGHTLQQPSLHGVLHPSHQAQPLLNHHSMREDPAFPPTLPLPYHPQHHPQASLNVYQPRTYF